MNTYNTYNTYRDRMLDAANLGDVGAIFNVGLCALNALDISETECMQLVDMACELMDVVCCGTELC